MTKVVFIFFFVGLANFINGQSVYDTYGALIRSDTSERKIYLCFTGHDFNEGFEYVQKVLENQQVKASFFLTGDFVRNNVELTNQLVKAGHYIGAHSDKHLLYCDWTNRDSLLYSTDIIKEDIALNVAALIDLGPRPKYFMPPYEWYNAKVVEIAGQSNQITINFSPGTRSNADYTTPEMANYQSSEEILESIYIYEAQNGFNGFHLLIHPGTSPLRTDKFYLHLDSLVTTLKQKGYQFNKFE